jgi:regulator of PEP synthase PpsR (kinase-PPPase family)
MKEFHLHLVSDATGETVISVARAAVTQFEDVHPIEHLWSLVRSRAQVEKILAAVEANQGIVMFTLVDRELRKLLQEGCRAFQVPCIPLLDPVMAALSTYLGAESRDQPGRQHALDSEYFQRIDAMTYVLSHDDGQSPDGLKNANVILVGVSRTSKTPTCFYLANRGLKAANVPIVPGLPLPRELEAVTGPLIVGLMRNPESLVEIRRNRLHVLNQDQETEYVDIEQVRAEVSAARRLFTERGWPMIDVTRRSIEETAAEVIQLYTQRLEA